MKTDLSESLNRWRRANHIKQSHLASSLGVSQQAISAWERGTCLPSPTILARLRAMMRSTEPLNLDLAFIRNQSSIRAIIDLDGFIVLENSAGFANIWSDFLPQRGLALEDRLINEAQAIADNEIRWQIWAGDVALISGVSERHVDLDLGTAFLHRWQICFRRYGSRVVAEMVYEPAAPGEATGINMILRVDELAL